MNKIKKNCRNLPLEKISFQIKKFGNLSPDHVQKETS